MHQVTDLFTGVSGITATSPALSVAQRSGRLMYSVFRSNGYDLYAIDAPESVVAQPSVAYRPYGQSGASAAVLPPLQRTDATLVSLLNDPNKGLPPETEFPEQPYKPGLSLTYVGNLRWRLAAAQFGTFIGGGASLYFSDLLGNHNLVTGLNVQGSLKDVNAAGGIPEHHPPLQLGSHRASKLPISPGALPRETGNVGGEPALVDQQLIERQTNRDFFGLLSPTPSARFSGWSFRRDSATSPSIASSRPRLTP